MSQPNSNTKRSWGDHIIEWNPPPPPTHPTKTLPRNLTMTPSGIKVPCGGGGGGGGVCKSILVLSLGFDQAEQHISRVA